MTSTFWPYVALFDWSSVCFFPCQSGTHVVLVQNVFSSSQCPHFRLSSFLPRPPTSCPNNSVAWLVWRSHKSCSSSLPSEAAAAAFTVREKGGDTQGVAGGERPFLFSLMLFQGRKGGNRERERRKGGLNEGPLSPALLATFSTEVQSPMQ